MGPDSFPLAMLYGLGVNRSGRPGRESLKGSAMIQLHGGINLGPSESGLFLSTLASFVFIEVRAGKAFRGFWDWRANQSEPVATIREGDLLRHLSQYIFDNQVGERVF